MSIIRLLFSIKLYNINIITILFIIIILLFNIYSVVKADSK